MEIVNDEFWLGYAKEKIDKGPEVLNTAAAGLSTLIGTFWGLYTLLFLSGTALIQLKTSDTVLLLLTSPIALLIGAYCYSQWAQMPLIFHGIDPRIPRQVQEVYKKTIAKKKVRLWIATAITFFSALIIAIALIASNFLQAGASSEGGFDIAFEKNGEQANLIVSGSLEEKSIVWVDVQAIYHTDSTARSVKNYPRIHGIATKNNRFDYSTSVLPWPDTIIVTAYWKEKEEATTINSLTKSSPGN